MAPEEIDLAKYEEHKRRMVEAARAEQANSEAKPAEEIDLLTLDNSLIQAERHLMHAKTHIGDARMVVEDEMYELGLIPADRAELQRLLQFLDETLGTVISAGNQTRPILDTAK